MEKNYVPMPYVIKQTSKGERSYDIFSRLLEERIIFIADQITDDLATIVVAQLLLLEAEDPKKDIMLYINSPGGSISAGMAIYDTMKYIKCDVSTICIGMAASMGSFLLAGGTKGKRYALPNSEVLIHQPLGGAEGQATEIEIAAKHIIATKKKMNVCILPKLDKKTITAVDVCWIAPSNKYNSKYLMYYMLSPCFQNEVMKKVSGSTRKRISKKNLINIPLNIHNIDAQNDIVEYIDNIFEKLDSF